MNWYVKVLKQYADFGGRARRREYWMFALVNAIVLVVLYAVLPLVAPGNVSSSDGNGGFQVSYGPGAMIAMIAGGVYSLALLVPSLAVSVRRLHDTDRSGWWMFISLVPLVGGIVLLVFDFMEGTPGPNRFGADPKTAVTAPAGAAGMAY